MGDQNAWTVNAEISSDYFTHQDSEGVEYCNQIKIEITTWEQPSGISGYPMMLEYRIDHMYDVHGKTFRHLQDFPLYERKKILDVCEEMVRKS